MTILKIKEIADYINNYINNNNNGIKTNNYKSFDYFFYNNFNKILSNLLNADYDTFNNHIILKNYIITIDNDNDKYEIYITEDELIEPNGPI
jgi:hypothetical protein